MTTTKATPDVPTVFYQSPERAAYSAGAVREGADIEFAGPTEPGWYFMVEFGDWSGPFDSEADAWGPVLRAVNTHGELIAALWGVIEAAEANGWDITGPMPAAVQAARAALAKAEGDKS